MPKVRAAVCREFGKPFTIETVTIPDPGPGEVLVRIGACAVCHSDITYAEGKWGGRIPAIYGHEAAGKIEAVGSGVTLPVGQNVIVTLIKACGTCRVCASGRWNHCESPGATPDAISESGEAIERSLYCGAFAEAVVVDQSQIAPVPATMPMDVASLIACGVITGVGAAVRSADLKVGETAVVIGAGGVGLNVIQGARIAGASRIIALDLLEEKLAAAREFGATHTILASDPKPWQKVRELTNGRGADAVFVSIGSTVAYDQAPKYMAQGGGRIVIVGLPHQGGMSEYEPIRVAMDGQAIWGSKMGDIVLVRDIPWIVDLYEQGRLKLDELITRRWRLEEINAAIEDTKTGLARRNVIVF